MNVAKLILLLILLQGCSLVAPRPSLYYQLVGVNFAILESDDLIDQRILDTIYISTNKESVFLNTDFNIISNRKLQKGRYPSDMHSKCSFEKITSYVILLTTPSKEVINITDNFSGIDSLDGNKNRQVSKVNLYRYPYKSVSDFVQKFNECNSESCRGRLLNQYGLVLKGILPIKKEGLYSLTTEIKFTDGRILTREITIFIKI